MHIGLGAFFRSHQAWYTQHASDSKDWGIVAFTGRSPQLANELMAQDCRYTLITRGPEVDSFETIDSIVRAEPGDDLAKLSLTISNPATAIITLTITEAGYEIDPSLALVDSSLGRLVLALKARFDDNGRPLALISCDNMPHNAAVLKEALISLGSVLGPDFVSYLNSLSFVATSVDRITPTPTVDEVALVADQNFKDSIPVATEPFTDWILQGQFPLGRPDWESAGAKFVSEIENYENRKLWLLNGAHSLISTYGQLLGHNTVDEAISDVRVLDKVQTWWFEAAGYLTDESLDIENYQQRLLERFRNTRMTDLLERIAKDSLTKLRVRIAPVATKDLELGMVGEGATFALASYIAFVLAGFEVADSKWGELQDALEQLDPVMSIVQLISPTLASSDEFMDEVKRQSALLLGERQRI